MDPKQSTHQIMDRVKKFEYQRSRRRIFIFLILAFTIFIVGILVFVSIIHKYFEQDSFSMLQILFQDPEVVQLFWKDTLQTFAVETPLDLAVLSVFCITLLLALIFISKNRVRIAWRRITAVKNMSKQTQLTKNAVYLSLGFILIISIVVAFLFIKYLLQPVKNTYQSKLLQTQTETESLNNPATPNQEADVEVQAAVAENLTLTIKTPQNQATVTSKNLLVSGQTKPKAEVFINDKELKSDSAGNFSMVISLDEGQNIIAVAANDDLGNYAAQEIEVFYTPEG